jgi:hypothetical protein
MSAHLQGSVSDPRATVEYSTEHEKAGSIRMYETLPLFTGRSTLEGVYNQASLSTHAVYYLTSELGERSPNPFRNREFSSFDTDNALRHLRLFNTRDVVALSGKLVSALLSRDDVNLVARVPPYTIFRLEDAGPGYVEPLAYAPVRSSPRGWREKAYRWFTRKPQTSVHLVFTEDARFATVERDEWLAPPAVPLAPGVKVRESVDVESLTIETSRVGHPLLVKVSYHPRWKAEGADGPYLVSPSMMMVVPRQTTVRLRYSETPADWIGRFMTGAAVLWGLARLPLRRRSVPRAKPAPAAVPVPQACGSLPAPSRWGGAVPGAILLLLASSRLAPGSAASPADEARRLRERATLAFGAEQWEDAAEYARHALARRPSAEVRDELRCLRGESLLRAQRPREAAEAFEAVVREAGLSAATPRALFGLQIARALLGEGEVAAAARERLLREFPGTAWAERASSVDGRARRTQNRVDPKAGRR